MSIKALALDLYRAHKVVGELRKTLEKASADEQELLKNELKKAENEYRILRNMLDGEKDTASSRKRFSRFSSFG
ncbi:hypothetical protein DGMP_09880 [Desulfomarina profundi]|uniref:Uncharacterized protein n=1 Tax=Desulfomarina profundi TaxID=2772557 RepID=A0A8D5FGQ5_9BACT|nr:hypothetical protein [Desulfomarina profundi]BCL60295.1 hypothetical protein DGMP_09880 [Desulfomarina profundi]